MNEINVQQDYFSVYLELKKSKQMKPQEQQVYDVYLENVMQQLNETNKSLENHEKIKTASKVYFLS